MEQALVFLSIVIGIAVADQIVSLNRLLRARSRVRWDPLLLAVAALVFLTLVQTWWAVARTPKGPLTIGGFLPMLVALVLVVLLALATLPDEVPAAAEIDLRDYYREQSPYIWTLLSLAFGWIIVTGAVEAVRSGAGLGPWLIDRSFEFVFLGIMASLVVVRRRWWHWVGLLVLSIGPVGWLSRSIG